MGDAGGFLRHSIGGVGGLVPAPDGAGVGGCGGRDHCLPLGPRNRCRKRLSRVELLPEPGSESRFRISVQDLAGARGSDLVGEISWLSDHPGGPQVFSLELSARKSRRPDPSSPVALVPRTGFLKKKILFFPKRLLGYLDHLFFGFCSNNSYLKSDHF